MTSRLSTWLAPLALLIACSGLQGCSKDDDPAPDPAPSGPTGSPFSATLDGPDVAAPGDQVTATLTNTGRLPDRYRFVSDPVGAATITPVEFSLAPEESAEVTIEVATPPVIIRVESSGAGGTGESIVELSIGGQDGT